MWKSRVDSERDYPWDQVQRRRQDPLQLCDGICFGGACSAHVHSEPRKWCIMGFSKHHSVEVRCFMLTWTDRLSKQVSTVMNALITVCLQISLELRKRYKTVGFTLLKGAHMYSIGTNMYFEKCIFKHTQVVTGVTRIQIVHISTNLVIICTFNVPICTL